MCARIIVRPTKNMYNKMDSTWNITFKPRRKTQLWHWRTLYKWKL